MAEILRHLRKQILLADGAMGTIVQNLNLDLQTDYLGHENCTDILCLSRPDIVIDVHKQYLDAGADLITTNSFGGSAVTLAEFGIADQCVAINKAAAELAQQAIKDYGASKPRYVMGDIGPGTKLPSLGHASYDQLKEGFLTQSEGLLLGGVDVILIETCQDLLQIKAAINGARAAMQKTNRFVPLFVQLTVEMNGTMLTGSNIAAACAVLSAMDVDLIGLNCATGPREMQPHLQYLSENFHGLVSVQPNAGLPELIDGKTCYPLSPEDLQNHMQHFVQQYRVNMIGGCCGTTPKHIQALDAMLKAPRVGTKTQVPDQYVRAASLYSSDDYIQENAFFSIGERCNANGSKKFRELQAQEDWESCINIALQQQKEGSHAIDLCTAHVDRNEDADMQVLMQKFSTSLHVPVVIDSTDTAVIENALKLYGGKAIINSINLEDGTKEAIERLKLAKEFGASVIALTIDEQGMAKTAKRKVEIAERLISLACDEYKLAQQDLMIDPLTFTIATGNVDDRSLALETLQAITTIRKKYPKVQIVLGLSNVSFGLKMAARHILNSVFLHHAMQAGMNAAIVHLSKIMPLHQIDPKEQTLFEDMIFNRYREGYNPLEEVLTIFADRSTTENKPVIKDLPPKDQLKQRIIDGDMMDLESNLKAVLDQGVKPLDIINKILLDGMKEVGELFGSGKMQLPFVLKSAETMKASVRFLEPMMDKSAGPSRGKIVLATVKGDVHDIGKNLVDIIFTNNGFEVINLGIRQDIETIFDAAKQHNADVIGMSGLLVRSAMIMKDNLSFMHEQTGQFPVILGGAALTRRFVDEDCVACYPNSSVFYAKDAFDGMKIMEDILSGNVEQRQKRQQKKQEAEKSQRPIDYSRSAVCRDQIDLAFKNPKPPFWGARHIEHVPTKNLLQYMNMRMLFRFHFGDKSFKSSQMRAKDWDILKYIHQITEQESIYQPKAMYGYFPCLAKPDGLMIMDIADHQKERLFIPFPRQNYDRGIAISDFYGSDHLDVVGLQVVTVGQKASDVAADWLQQDRYQDYLYAHSYGVELAEAMAEYVHAKMRSEMKISQHDAMDMTKLLNKGYQGARWSFGYPACPDIEQQRGLLELLDAVKIGLTMDKDLQMHPEQSTMAIVSFHPQACYFAV